MYCHRQKGRYGLWTNNKTRIEAEVTTSSAGESYIAASLPWTTCRALDSHDGRLPSMSKFNEFLSYLYTNPRNSIQVQNKPNQFLADFVQCHSKIHFSRTVKAHPALLKIFPLALDESECERERQRECECVSARVRERERERERERSCHLFTNIYNSFSPNIGADSDFNLGGMLSLPRARNSGG